MLTVHKAIKSFPEQLELFEKLAVQNAIESSFYTNVVPLNPNLNSEVLEFEFVSSEHFIDASDIFLY